MAYQVLARKWRPQDFTNLVGQDAIVTALRNALTEERIAQAYLFSGIRGVGKTTAARVLAKALNCENRTGADPCNACPLCLGIGDGSSLDVLEVDAATYSKVEQIRELTETLRYAPASGRYKVVVLDEVHRLSRQAFDALLKIVEEPPEHLVFIFATTEIDAVPATILSRCQEFQFRRVASAELARHLRRICDAEGIEASDHALRLIARAGEGSVRDSVALLDQMATYGSNQIGDQDAQKLLGGLDGAVFQQLLTAILAGDQGPVIGIVHDIEARGWDPHHIFGQFLAYCRDALHLALGGAHPDLDLPAEDAQRLADVVSDYGYEGVLQVLQLLLTSEQIVKRSEFGSLALEIAWLRAAELPKVTQIQSMLAGGETGAGETGAVDTSSSTADTRPAIARETRGQATPPSERSVRGHTKPPSAAAPSSPFVASPTSAPLPSTPLPESVPPEPSRAPDITPPVDHQSGPAADLGPLPDRTHQLLEWIRSHRQSLAAHLRQADLALADNRLVIRPRHGDTLLPSALERTINKRALEQGIEEVWQRPIPWRLDLSAPAPGPESVVLTRTPESETTEAVKAAASQPVVAQVLELFGGSIQNVESQASEDDPSGEDTNGEDTSRDKQPEAES